MVQSEILSTSGNRLTDRLTDRQTHKPSYKAAVAANKLTELRYVAKFLITAISLDWLKY